MRAPLTSELSECLDGISEIIRQSRVFMAKQVEKEGASEGVYGEVQLFFENSESQLEDIFLNKHRRADRAECNVYLASIKEAADRAEELAEKLSHGEGNARAGEALKILAQALHFAMPPLLRWGHGYPGRQAFRTVEKLNFRLAKLMRNFSLSLTAA